MHKNAQVEVAQAMGVSLTTVKKWLRRYRLKGPSGLLDRSSRPSCSRRRVSSTLRVQITDLRRQRRTGRFIAARLGVSGASVSRILRQAHLSRWRELEPRPPVRRYERERPGELLHLDTKNQALVGTFVVLLSAFLERASHWRYGYDLSRETDLKAGTLYPILMRLSDAGWLERRWEEPSAPGRPPRHMYRLTQDG